MQYDLDDFNIEFNHISPWSALILLSAHNAMFKIPVRLIKASLFPLEGAPTPFQQAKAEEWS